MVWLGAYEMRKSEAVELRLYAPQKEKQFFQEHGTGVFHDD